MAPLWSDPDMPAAEVRCGLLPPADARIRVDRAALVNALRRDKKRQSKAIHFVLLESIGKAVVVEILMEELEAMVYRGGD
jgi:3-dehydroquinate synthetase